MNSDRERQIPLTNREFQEYGSRISAVMEVSRELASWIDRSPPTVPLVTVDENVKLEVLDWGS